MSHITKVKLRIRDLDALEEAGVARGFELRRNQKTHKSYYGTGKCEHALRLKNAHSSDYEIGLVKADDGDGFELAVDTWGQARLVEAAGGPAFNGLRREYAAAVAAKRAKAKLALKGFVVKRENLGNRIRLRLVRR